jgi:stalled ribosome rescue protein Dom34
VSNNTKEKDIQTLTPERLDFVYRLKVINSEIEEIKNSIYNILYKDKEQISDKERKDYMKLTIKLDSLIKEQDSLYKKKEEYILKKYKL